MLDANFLKILRCPIDPQRNSPLLQTDESKLTCEHCKAEFPIRDGFPILLVDEAKLPENCPTHRQLPCQTPDQQSS